ncbi:HD-GYP domain-containing protein [Pseudoroseomonas cervicalis]|uniref:HD-GYP domain-containing protein n=1 Tax=Teichococcus cervicalis TaxID=204525 RepID=UPI0022F19AFC|nr:HD domain-containing phosphohydrolase [Pseudoroseomonas cervicalis]WBV41737.1 HD domain-containing protein [Pseudoroseomonas cervicalis]
MTPDPATPPAGPSWPEDMTRQSQRLLAALRRHHPATADHSVRVATVLLAIRARRPQGLGPAPLVAAAGLLHDLGKLFLPVGLLDSDRRLTEAQLRRMRAHPETGAETLQALGFPEPLVAVARYHHERWDGTGYPCGLPGSALAPLVRAAGVADALVAMVEPGRAYRRHLELGAALRELRACAGRQFDPDYAALLTDDLAPALAEGLGLGAAPRGWRTAMAGQLPSPLLEHAFGLPAGPR